MDLGELDARLDELTQLSSRGLVIELTCRADRRNELMEHLRARFGPAARIVAVEVGEASRAALGELNAGRDVLLGSVPAIVLIASSPEAARLGRARAPDLTSALDLSAELVWPSPTDWPETVTAIRRALADRHRAIDLTGLIPGATEVVELPLVDAYARSAGLPDERLPSERPTLVLGEPGAGKTTAIRWLCWTCASGGAQAVLPERPLVLFASLSSWAAANRQRPIDVLTFLSQWAGQLCGSDAVPLGDHLADLVLLLDGLDEVGDDVRPVLAEHLRRLHAAGACIVATGRIHVAGERWAEAWQVARLGEPTQEDIQRLIFTVLSARGRTVDAAGAARRLASRITTDHGDLSALRRNPLMLVFVAVLVELGREIPTLRVELYRDLIEMLLASWRRLRSGTEAKALRRADVLRVLAPLGWAMVERGATGLTEAELLEVLLGIELRREPDSDRARAAAAARLAQLRDDTALLSTEGVWRFVHPTLAEYFAALAVLQDEAALRAVEQAPYAPRWGTVLVFAVSLATEIEPRDEVVSRLAAAMLRRRRGRKDATVPWVIANVLREAPGLAASQRARLADEMLRVTLTLKLTQSARLNAVISAFGNRAIDDSTREVYRRWLCPPRAGVRIEHLVESVSAQALIAMLQRAGLSTRGLLAAALRHPDPRRRSLLWAEHDRRARMLLDPAGSALYRSERFADFVEAAIEVYGAEAVAAAGLK